MDKEKSERKTALVQQIIKVNGKDVYYNYGLCGKGRLPQLEVPSEEILPYINEAIEHSERTSEAHGEVSPLNTLVRRFVELSDGTEIDLRRVTHVTPVKGDPAYLRYKAVLDSGNSIEIYEERQDVRHMKRNNFLELWKKALQNA